MSQKDKLEKLLECYGISWGELSTLNDAQIKAIEVAYYYCYGANIAKSADKVGNALKVLAIRLRDVSVELEKAGED